ncbi:decarboxylase [Candidatus Woesearchaeota archaeon]|nr:decarboxylase [Candidatus Woesearchaeota archaeon]
MAKFVLSKQKMLAQYETVAKYCDEVSFSAKTNYEIASLMEELTPCTFNLHFAAEVERIKDESRVWFFPQGIDKKELQELIQKGVKKFVVDNENDLKTILDTIDSPIDLLLRMKLKERSVHTGKYFVYGMKAETVNKLVAELKDNEHIEKLGVHFHRKSQNISEWNLLYELEQILDAETLKAIDILDIGGGIPIAYKNFEAKVHERIFSEFEKLRDWVKQNDITLIIEPGRFIAGPAVKLVTTVKNVYNDNIVVDASVYNCAIDTFVVHHKLLVEGESEKGTAYTIKGYTPCSADIFRYKVYLNTVKQGDEIVFLNAGAYSFSSDFCTLPKIPTEVEE